MRIYYKNLRNRILDTLKNSSIKNQIKITEKDSGLHFLIEIINGLTDSEIKSIIIALQLIGLDLNKKIYD